MTKKTRLIKRFDNLKSQIHSRNEENDLVQSNLYHFTNTTKFPAIITSNFCLEFNNNYLWVNYGDNHKGLALGFSPKYKKHEEIDYSKESPSVNMHVKYGKKAISDDLLSFVETFARILIMTKSKSEYLTYVDGFVRNMYPNMPRYKSNFWKNEKEHRWCMMDRGPTKKILPKFIVGGRAVNENVVFEQLCEVIIGRDSVLVQSEVEDLLGTNGYDLSKISISKM
ncbi:MAG: DUF2971 domain-containing protein [Proteobacteria bacterium]|nr:DUF2971 domain-containing protein [Pseudomonadota bacterium]